MTTSKQHELLINLGNAVNDIQNEIMLAWKAVMLYEEQLRNNNVYEASEEVLHQLISDEKFKIQILTQVLDKLFPTENNNNNDLL
jgi:hypothetical protein